LSSVILPQVARGVRRDPLAHLGDQLELAPAAFVGLGGGHLTGQLLVAAGEQDGRVGGDVHRLQLLFPGQRAFVVGEVEGGGGGRDLALEVEQALAVDLAVGHRVARGPLLHELGEDAG